MATMYQWNDQYSSIQLPSGLTGVVAIAVGLNHGLALKSDGTVAAWGLYVSAPATVPNGVSNVTAIAAGYDHAVALRADGTAGRLGRDRQGRDQRSAGLGVNVVATLPPAVSTAWHCVRTVPPVGWGQSYYGWADVPADRRRSKPCPMAAR